MTPATLWGHAKVLDTGKRSFASCHFEDAPCPKIVGQQEAIEFINRLDSLVVSRPLKADELDEALKGDLGHIVVWLSSVLGNQSHNREALWPR